MGFIIIDKIKNNNKKIMIFTEGTILKPKHKNNFLKTIACDFKLLEEKSLRFE